MVDSWQQIERNVVIENSSGVAPTLTVTNEDADFPKENLQDYNRRKQWKSSTATGNKLITVDLGSASILNGVALINHNKASAVWTTVKLQEAGTAASPGAWNDVVTIDFATPLGGAADSQDFFVVFSNTNARHWRLNIGGSTAAPALGVFVLGRTFEYNAPEIKGGHQVQWDYHLKETTGENGGRFIEQVGRRTIIVKMKRSSMDRKDEVSQWMPMGGADTIGAYNLHHGALKPFVYIPRPITGFAYGETDDGVKGQCYYMRWQPSPISVETFDDIWSDALELVEEV